MNHPLVQLYLNICLLIGLSLTLIGGVALGFRIAYYLCDCIYIWGNHSVTFVAYLRAHRKTSKD